MIVKSLMMGCLTVLLGSRVALSCGVKRTDPVPETPFYERVFFGDCTDAQRSIDPEELLRALHSGSVVRVQGGRIRGGLDFREAVRHGKIEGSVMILDSVVLGEVDAQEILFEGDLLFWNTIFDRSVDFTGSRFRRFVDFRGALFRDEARFAQATFNGAVGFIGVAFGERADYSGSFFQHPAGFGRSTFSGGAVFDHVQFGHHADFSWASFGGIGSFREATFVRSADFSRASFSETADFRKAAFWGEGAFRATSFSKDVSFVGVRLGFGLSTLGIRYPAVRPLILLLLAYSTLCLWIKGMALEMIHGYPHPRWLITDRQFVSLITLHLIVWILFYTSPRWFFYPPSPLQLFSVLIVICAGIALFCRVAYRQAMRAKRPNRPTHRIA